MSHRFRKRIDDAEEKGNPPPYVPPTFVYQNVHPDGRVLPSDEEVQRRWMPLR